MTINDEYRPKVSALGKLLKKYDVKMSATQANKVFISLGIIEKRKRPSELYKNEVRVFTAIKEEYSEFGINVMNPIRKKETLIHWDVQNFEKLAALLKTSMADTPIKSMELNR